MNSFDLLKKAYIGKLITHVNRYGREVTLEVEDVKARSETRDIGPSTPQNDWWPESETREWIDINFIDGSKIEVSMNSPLKISEKGSSNRGGIVMG